MESSTINFVRKWVEREIAQCLDNRTGRMHIFYRIYESESMAWIECLDRPMADPT